MEVLGITDFNTVLQMLTLDDATFICIVYQPPINATMEQELDIHWIYTWAQFCKYCQFLSDDGNDFEVPKGDIRGFQYGFSKYMTIYGPRFTAALTQALQDHMLRLDEHSILSMGAESHANAHSCPSAHGQ